MIVQTSTQFASLLTIVLTGCAGAGASSDAKASTPTVVETPQSSELASSDHAKDGFVVLEEDGRLWVFVEGSEELQAFRSQGELAKHVIMPGAGPDGMTIKSPDRQTVIAYVAAKPGFVTEVVDERIWVFREGSQELADFRSKGELAKHVIRPGAGPMGITLKAPDTETCLDYVVACEGFTTFVEDGRVWVFRDGDPELESFLEVGEPAKYVILPGAGPLQMTLKGPDKETLTEYSARVQV